MSSGSLRVGGEAAVGSRTRCECGFGTSAGSMGLTDGRFRRDSYEQSRAYIRASDNDSVQASERRRHSRRGLQFQLTRSGPAAAACGKMLADAFAELGGPVQRSCFERSIVG